MVVLTDRPRLVYFDPATRARVGEIAWDSAAPATCRRIGRAWFDVVAGHRNYHLSAPEGADGGSAAWIAAVEAAVAAAAPPALELAASNVPLALVDAAAVDRAAAAAPAEPDGARGAARTMTGYLWKEGQVMRSMKRRYFVLEGTVLSYYPDAEKARAGPPKGSLDVVSARLPATPGATTSARLTASARSVRGCPFEVYASNCRLLKCEAETPEARDAWLRAIAAAVGEAGRA